MTMSETNRSGLERDLTEALLRLKLARAGRDRAEIEDRENLLNELLDRLAADADEDGGS